MSTTLTKAVALIREAIHASAATDAIATVYLPGLSAEDASTALSYATTDSDEVDSVESPPGEMIEAWGTDDHGHDWRIAVRILEAQS